MKPILDPLARRGTACGRRRLRASRGSAPQAYHAAGPNRDQKGARVPRQGASAQRLVLAQPRRPSLSRRHDRAGRDGLFGQRQHPLAGPYADQVERIVEYLSSNVQPSGLITGPTQEQGYSMYGHGFSLMFLSSCYGMETDDRMRHG